MGLAEGDTGEPSVRRVLQISTVKGRRQISDSDVGLRWQEITMQTVLEWILFTSAILGQAAIPGHSLPNSLL